MAGEPMVSVVIPMFNERGNVEGLFELLQELRRSWDREHEIIFVDDGSTDGTSELLAELPRKDPGIRVLRFLRNFGQKAAVTAGFEHARGGILAIMDGDLQLTPMDMPKLVAAIDEGAEAAVGFRSTRKEGFFSRRLPSWLANRAFSLFLGVHFKDMGCGMQAFRRDVVAGLHRHGIFYQYPTVYAVWRGSRVEEVPVSFRPRVAGQTKYGLSRLLTLFLDILLAFATKPVEVAVLSVTAVALSGIGILGLLSLILLALVGHPASPAWWVLGLILVISGLQIGVLAMQSQKITLLNSQIQNQPLYVIGEQIEEASGPPAAEE